MHATTEARRPSHYAERQPVLLAVARQSPIHLAPLQEQLFLKMSSQLGRVWTGPELLRFGWSRAGLSWDHDDERTQANNRQHVIGAMHELRALLRAHGQYEIDTCYPKQDGERGWRLREMTDEDRARLRGKGYFGGSWYEVMQLAAPAEQAALGAGEANGAAEHHGEVVGPLLSQIGWPVDNEGRAFDGDRQLLESVDVAG